MPRSARSSSTSRYDNAKRRYQRTESTITSGGKQKPAKADRGTVAGRGRRVLIAPVCLVTAGATAPLELLGVDLHQAYVGGDAQQQHNRQQHQRDDRGGQHRQEDGGAAHGLVPDQRPCPKQAPMLGGKDRSRVRPERVLAA